MAIHQLKQRFIDTVNKPGRYADGGGLYLQLGKTGSKSWVFIYSRRPFGKPGQSEMGLGSADTVSLDGAREAARDCRQQIKDHIDPLAAREEERQAKQQAQAKRALFEDVAARYLEINTKERREPWAFGTTRQTKMIINHYLKPLHGWAIADIEVGQLATILQPVRSKPGMAEMVQLRMDHIFRLSKAMGCRKDNPAELEDAPLGELVPWLKRTERPDPEHFKALPWQSVPAFMTRLLSPPNKDYPWMTCNEAAEIMGCDRSVILLAIHAGKLRAKQDDKVADQRNAFWQIEPEELCLYARLYPHREKRSEQEIRAILDSPESLRRLLPIKAYVLAYQILTATRPGEARYARWSEIDDSNKVWIWTLPWQRIKPRRKMRVKVNLDIPLCPFAVTILKTLKTAQEAEAQQNPDYIKPDFIFAHIKVLLGESHGSYIGRPPSDTAIRDHKTRMLLPGEEADIHGFRSSFASWSDDHGFDRNAKEMALSHGIGNSTEQLYSRHGKRFNQRKDLMFAWGDFCEHGRRPADIIPLRQPSMKGESTNVRD